MVMSLDLGKGLEVIFDDLDYDLISPYKWYRLKRTHTFYAAAKIKLENGKTTSLLMHRLLTQAPCGFDVDHADRNGLNNTRQNLRVCTRTQNQANSQKRKTKYGKPTSSQYKGVYRSEDKLRWRAQLGSHKYLGTFGTEIEAAEAYNNAARAAYGEFASLNLIPIKG